MKLNKKMIIIAICAAASISVLSWYFIFYHNSPTNSGTIQQEAGVIEAPTDNDSQTENQDQSTDTSTDENKQQKDTSAYDYVKQQMGKSTMIKSSAQEVNDDTLKADAVKILSEGMNEFSKIPMRNEADPAVDSVILKYFMGYPNQAYYLYNAVTGSKATLVEDSIRLFSFSGAHEGMYQIYFEIKADDGSMAFDGYYDSVGHTIKLSDSKVM